MDSRDKENRENSTKLRSSIKLRKLANNSKTKLSNKSVKTKLAKKNVLKSLNKLNSNILNKNVYFHSLAEIVLFNEGDHFDCTRPVLVLLNDVRHTRSKVMDLTIAIRERNLKTSTFNDPIVDDTLAHDTILSTPQSIFKTSPPTEDVRNVLPTVTSFNKSILIDKQNVPNETNHTNNNSMVTSSHPLVSGVRKRAASDTSDSNISMITQHSGTRSVRKRPALENDIIISDDDSNSNISMITRHSYETKSGRKLSLSPINEPILVDDSDSNNSNISPVRIDTSQSLISSIQKRAAASILNQTSISDDDSDYKETTSDSSISMIIRNSLPRSARKRATSLINEIISLDSSDCTERSSVVVERKGPLTRGALRRATMAQNKPATADGNSGSNNDNMAVTTKTPLTSDATRKRVTSTSNETISDDSSDCTESSDGNISDLDKYPENIVVWVALDCFPEMFTKFWKKRKLPSIIEARY